MGRSLYYPQLCNISEDFIHKNFHLDCQESVKSLTRDAALINAAAAKPRRQNSLRMGSVAKTTPDVRGSFFIAEYRFVMDCRWPSAPLCISHMATVEVERCWLYFCHSSVLTMLKIPLMIVRMLQPSK